MRAIVSALLLLFLSISIAVPAYAQQQPAPFDPFKTPCKEVSIPPKTQVDAYTAIYLGFYIKGFINGHTYRARGNAAPLGAKAMQGAMTFMSAYCSEHPDHPVIRAVVDLMDRVQTRGE